MAVSPVRDATAANLTLLKKLKMDHYKATLAADLVLTEDYPPIIILDPGGAGRNVDLPAEANSENLMFCIVNIADAAETLTVRDDAAATIATVAGSAAGATNSRAWFYCDGVAWYSLGVAADT